MAHLYRLIAALVVLLSAASPARADFHIGPLSAGGTCPQQTWNGNNPSTVMQAFLAAANTCQASAGNTYTFTSCASYVEGPGLTGVPCSYVYKPPTGSTENRTYTVGYTYVSINNCPPAGTSAGNWTLPGGTGPKQVCDTDISSGDSSQPGCYASGTADFAVGSGANQSSTAPMKYSGAKCAPNPGGSYDGTSGTAPAPNTSAAPTPCPPGKV